MSVEQGMDRRFAVAWMANRSRKRREVFRAALPATPRSFPDVAAIDNAENIIEILGFEDARLS